MGAEGGLSPQLGKAARSWEPGPASLRLPGRRLGHPWCRPWAVALVRQPRSWSAPQTPTPSRLPARGLCSLPPLPPPNPCCLL